jgi:surface antigen
MENNTPAAPAKNPAYNSLQCTWRAAEFWKEMTGRYPNWGGDAHAWDDNAGATGWAVRSWPRPDSIVVWQKNQISGGVGHVGYVADTKVSGGKLLMKVYDRNRVGQGVDKTEWLAFQPGMRFIVPPPRTAPTR